MTIATLRPAPHASARSCVATIEIMIGASLAHTWAEGALPSLPLLIGLATLVCASSVVVLRGGIRLRTMVVGMGLAQFGLHAALALMAPAEHAHGASAAAPLELTWQTVAAHSLVAVISAAAWAVQRRLLEVLFSWPAAVAPLPAQARQAPATGNPARAHARRWLTGAPRRGPPASFSHA